MSDYDLHTSYFKSSTRTTCYVARYLYQILKGCGDPKCAKTYCKGNFQKVFRGKRTRSNAAVNLAMHLASLRGGHDLCSILQQDQIPQSIAILIDENEPLKSPILSNNQFPKSKNSDVQNDVRSQAILWANVKSVVPASAYGRAFISTYFEKMRLMGKNGDDFSFVNKFIKFVFQFFASSQWEELIRDSPPYDLYEDILSNFEYVFNSLSFDKRLYVARYLVNSINSLSFSLGLNSDTFSKDTFIHEILLEILRKIVLNTKATTWSYLNLRMTSTLPLTSLTSSRETRSRSLYHSLVGINMLKAWPVGSSVAPISLKPYIDIFLNTGSSRIVKQDYPELKNLVLIPRAKLPPIASDYFNALLLQPMYDPDTKQRYLFLTEGGSHLLPFQERVDLLRYLCLKRMNASIQQAVANRRFSDNLQRMIFPLSPLVMTSNFSILRRVSQTFTVKVSRDEMIEDAVEALKTSLYDWDVIHRPLKVQFGKSELAVDQGGVQVEFFNELGNQLIKDQSGYFQRDEISQYAWFYPGTKKTSIDYEYIGLLCGLAVYNGCTISVEFPRVFYRMIQHTVKTCKEKLMVTAFSETFFKLEDMEDIYPDIARSFKFMRANSSKLSDWDIPYQFNFISYDGITKSYPLRSSYIYSTVTAENVDQFIQEYLMARFYSSVAENFHGFYLGFTHFLPLSALRSFSALELRTVVEGTKSIDVLELKALTTYDGFTYSSNVEDKKKLNVKTSPTVEYFWNIVEKFNQKELADLLEFVTGTNRIPSGGMERMEFIIQNNGTDHERLPSSSVCFSRLLLPEYTSQQQLETMLRLALNHSVGFGLL